MNGHGHFIDGCGHLMDGCGHFMDRCGHHFHVCVANHEWVWSLDGWVWSSFRGCAHTTHTYMRAYVFTHWYAAGSSTGSLQSGRGLCSRRV